MEDNESLSASVSGGVAATVANAPTMASAPSGESGKPTITPEAQTPSAPAPAPQRKRAGRPPKDKATERKLKIVVYAICKDEEQFVTRWMDSMKEADAVVVLDTGSRDGTVAALKKAGAQVETQIFNPWRFDTSRNASIDLALRLHPDADLLVCTDLDEILLAGWREKLERTWKMACAEAKKKGVGDPTTAQYEYVWNFNRDGSDATKFWYEKIHTPQSGARWSHPVHEILSYPGKKVMVRIPGMRLEHHADPTKSRSQYLGLLEMSVKEAPLDDRNCHYLCREYMFRQMWDQCIATGKRHLSLPTARWRAERANSMRFIARAYGEKHDALRQQIWLWRAINECAEQREACLDLMELLHGERDWVGLVQVSEICLSRTVKVMSYITKSEAWGSRPWDLYTVGLWRVGRINDAMAAIEKAIELNPTNERLLNNRRVMREFMEKRKQNTTKKN